MVDSFQVGNTSTITANSSGSLILTTFSYFLVFAEENTELNSGGFEWSFGNGAETPRESGLCMIKCQLIGLGASHAQAINSTIEAYVNGQATGKKVSTNTSKKQNLVEFEDSPFSLESGSVINFRTVDGSNGLSTRITGWFRRKVTATLTNATVD